MTIALKPTRPAQLSSRCLRNKYRLGAYERKQNDCCPTPSDLVTSLALGLRRLVPLHRGFDGFKFNGGLEVLGLDEKLNAAGDARGVPDEAGAFEGQHHLVHAGWRDLEVPLHVGFRRRSAEDTAVGVDEGQVLTLLVSERGSGDMCQTIDS